MRMLRCGARLALLCGIALFTSGCFLNALLSLVVVTSIEEEVQQTLATIQASASVRICRDLTATFGEVSVQCSYVINGVPIGTDFRLASQFGIFGVILDPLILQVPTAANNFTGTFGGGTTGVLSITEVSGGLPADINTTITPEPGTKLVIVDFPNPPPPLNQSYGFTLNFRLPGNAAPIPVKALFAARVQTNGQTFFVPMLPCQTNFANIPTIFLPASSTFQNVNLPTTGLQGCTGRLYTLSPGVGGATSVPTMSTWALLMVCALLVGYGMYRLRFTRAG